MVQHGAQVMRHQDTTFAGVALQEFGIVEAIESRLLS